MADRKTAVPIIRTKLHRPLVPGDLVCRQALHDRLEEGGHQPLTLVSAPAGYGKSTLVSHWLETRDGPGAWLSLDERDSDIRTFLGYVVAAIRTVVPEACAETQVQLEAESLSPLPVLAGCLGNDLEDLEDSLVPACPTWEGGGSARRFNRKIRGWQSVTALRRDLFPIVPSKRIGSRIETTGPVV